MDIKKLIDDTDFDNLNQLSKRWRKEGSPRSMATSQLSAPSEKSPATDKSLHERTLPAKQPSKENNHQHSNLDSSTHPEPSKRKREVMPQIID